MDVKRQAALIGATPPLLRWALETACPFLRSGRTRLPETAWRQLLPLQEISRAEREGRRVGDYCLASGSAAPDDLLGFSLDEVTRTYGGHDHVRETCRRCPANSCPSELAGCHGLIPLISWSEIQSHTSTAAADSNSTDPVPLNGPVQAQWEELLKVIERRLALLSPAAALPSPDLSNWYRLWSSSPLSGARLEAAWNAAWELQQAGILGGDEWSRWVCGLDLARRRQLPVWVELLPAGYSDGLTWWLPSRCQECGSSWRSPQRSLCQACGCRGSYRAEQRRKVLGRRPYLRLVDVLGRESAERLWRVAASGTSRPE